MVVIALVSSFFVWLFSIFYATHVMKKRGRSGASGFMLGYFLSFAGVLIALSLGKRVRM
jgi:hypothetical protein